jgi:AraC-like DNA-binding protein
MAGRSFERFQRVQRGELVGQCPSPLDDFLSSEAEEICLVKLNWIGFHSKIRRLQRHERTKKAHRGRTEMPELGLQRDASEWGAPQRGWPAVTPPAAHPTVLDDDTHVHLSEPVRSALQHMSRYFASPITLKDLSKVNNQTPSQMIRAFRKELGITPHAWLIRLRVERGTALLERGESIASVASEVGFVDQTHFTRHFKRVHGETPARFLIASRRARQLASV